MRFKTPKLFNAVKKSKATSLNTAQHKIQNTKMKYKIIVLDLDGTLTNDKKEITPRTKEALIKAQTEGVKVVLASGRPTYGITAIAEELELPRFEGYILAFNGGRIIDCRNNKVVFEQTLNQNLVPKLYYSSREAGLEILTYKGEGIIATKKTDQYVQIEASINKMKVEEASDFLQQIEYPINKCLIVGAPTPLHQLELQLAEQLKGKIDIYRSADYFLECVPVGIDKATSLNRLITELHIQSEEIIACGDNYNDLSMINFAGLGVAMANAPSEIQKQANYVTYSNEEDGVAHVVEKFILDQK